MHAALEGERRSERSPERHRLALKIRKMRHKKLCVTIDGDILSGGAWRRTIVSLVTCVSGRTRGDMEHMSLLSVRWNTQPASAQYQSVPQTEKE